MKSANQAIENVEYVRRLLEQKQPEFAASLECAASLVETQPREPTDDELIRRCSAAVRVACVHVMPTAWHAKWSSTSGACSGCGGCPGVQHGPALLSAVPDLAGLEPAKFPSGDIRRRS